MVNTTTGARRIFSLLLCLVFIVSGCATSRQAETFSVAEPDAENQFAKVNGSSVTEVKFGNRIYLRIVASGVVCQDEKITTYVQALRERLSPYAARETLPYVITPINDQRIYAVSTPGGYLYVSLGMLAYCQTESLLAFVVAHEIAQTQYKPQSFRLSKRLFGLMRSCAGLLKFVLPFTFGVSPGLKLVDRLVLKDISQETAVIHADAVALGILEKAGYRKDLYDEFRTAFSTFDAQVFPQLELYLTNRPVTADRMSALQKAIPVTSADLEWIQREQESYARVRRYVKELLRIHAWSFR